jgi:hypothetical protein
MSFFFGFELKEFENLKAGFGEFKLRKISDLFQLSTGLIQSRYHNRVAESNLSVRFLSLGDFDYDENRIKNEDELNILNRSKLKSESQTSSKKTEIPFDKVLRSTDYIINMRGEPKGFSMVEALNIVHDLNYVLANQFYILRPNKDIPYSIPYLHRLLDLVVIPELKRVYYQKKDELKEKKRKDSSDKISFNSFTMSDLSEISFNILVDVADQEKIIDKLNQLKALKLEAIENEKTFNDSFMKFSIVNPN